MKAGSGRSGAAFDYRCRRPRAPGFGVARVSCQTCGLPETFAHEWSMTQSNNWLQLQDQTCVVTGAGSGIGEVIALALAAVGAKVALLDRDGDAAARVAGDIQRSGGSIVNIASISANYPQSQSGAYSASKAGLVQVSRQMAVEWGAHGIRSNAICPGMVRTALPAGFYAVPGVEAKRAAMTASRRVGEPQDIAHAALFLLSPRSGYINGAELPVDGGMPAMLMDMVPRPGYNM